MTTRARRPTAKLGTDAGTEDPAARPALFGASPGDRIASASESWEHDATAVDARGGPPSQRPTLTEIDAPRPERSESVRVISMKERGALEPRAAPRPLHVQLRSMAEVAGVHTPASGLGRLAPPHDPQQARKRRQRDNVVWACVAILLACAISLGIWFIAGR